VGPAALALSLGACAIDDDPTPEIGVDDASGRMRAQLRLDDTAAACVRGAFDADPGITVVFNVAQPASAAQQDDFVEAMRPCLPNELVADELSYQLRTAFVGSGDSEQECLRGFVLSLDQGDQDRLLVGVANPTLAFSDPTFARLTEDMLATCDLQAGSTPGTGPSLTPDTDGDDATELLPPANEGTVP
jgi:hypothetical protein